MPEDSLRGRILEEIGKIPGDRLRAVLDLLKDFRECPGNRVLSFAGSWNELDESDFMEKNGRRRHRILNREKPHP
ncbi:MAG: hypothetical protein ACP5OS_09390 [Leptospirillia bacterium]